MDPDTRAPPRTFDVDMVVVSTNGGLVHELYRGYARSSPLGGLGDDSVDTLLGTLSYLISNLA